MKKATLAELDAINEVTLEYLRNLSPEEVHTLLYQMEDYHGFGKAVLPEPFLSETLASFGFTPSDVQLELVLVAHDLHDEIHHHQDATAAIIVLGQEEHLPNAVGAFAYLDDRWFPVSTGNRVDVPEGTVHGFTVEPRGMLYFLSGQSPPITGPDGRNDYHK